MTNIIENNLSQEIKSIMNQHVMTLSTAESCTGGLLGKIITDSPGSSDYYLGGIITYSNQMKEKLLNVSHQVLTTHGAVSAECAKEMAIGCQLNFDSDIAISVTGIAGPAGGTSEKPIGTVYYHIIINDNHIHRKLQLHGNRQIIRKAAVDYILKDLISSIESITAE